MRYRPHTRENIDQMLQVVGAKDLEAMFASIPADCRDCLHESPQFPKARRLDETAVVRRPCLRG
jgi:glycine cleavage system pyridoxal-binding protein P